MNTNRMLATLGVVLVLLAAGLVVAIRVFAAPAREERGDGAAVRRQLEVNRFVGIELSGRGELQLTRTPEYRAVLVASQEV